MSVILTRANTLGDWLFDEGSQIWLTSARAFKTEGRKMADEMPSIARQSYTLDQMSEWFWPDHDLEEDMAYEIVAGPVSWKGGKFDALFTAVANEMEYSVVFISNDMKNALYPYDGGFDLMIQDKSLETSLREDFAAWLPQNDYGL